MVWTLYVRSLDRVLAWSEHSLNKKLWIFGLSGVITWSELSPNRVPKWSEHGSQAVLGIGYISQSVLKIKNEIHWDPLRSISEERPNTFQMQSKHGLNTVVLTESEHSRTRMCGSLVWTQSEHSVSGVIAGSKLSPNRVPKWSERGSQAVLGIGYISQSVLKVKNEIHWDPLRSISEERPNAVRTQSKHGLNTVC